MDDRQQPVQPNQPQTPPAVPPNGTQPMVPNPQPQDQPQGKDQNQPPMPQASPPPTAVQENQSKPLSPQEARQELRQAIQGSGQILACATTVFKLFPDTLTVDRTKVTVTKRTFWQTAEVVSIRMEDVLNVTASVGPFFGSIKIVSRILSADKPYVIDRFWRDDAIRLKRVIQGYVIALQREIDCNSLPADELAQLLDKLGEDDHPM